MKRVKFTVTGFNLDQLINKLRLQGVVLYNIARQANNCVEFCVDRRYYKKVKGALNNYQWHVKYLGLTNYKQFLINNIAIFIAIPIIIAMIAISTRFTWNITIYGADEPLRQSVIEILKNNDIGVGKPIASSNEKIESILISQLPNVAQVSCARRGTTLIINISPKLVYTPETYQPITAKHNGIITGFSLISGTMAVSVGDFVCEGDILVYPFTLDKDGNQVSVNPIAEIKAKAYITGASKLNATSTKLVRTGKKHTTSCIQFLNRNLFSKKVLKPFALYETSVYNQYISSVLPIVKTTITYYELDYILVNNNLQAEQANVEQQSVDLAYANLPPNSEIVDQQTTSLIINDCLYSTTTLTIYTIIS